MHISFIQIENFRSFINSGPIEFEKINVLIGPNNAWKSSIIKAIQQIQDWTDFQWDIRKNQTSSSRTTLYIKDIPPIQLPWGQIWLTETSFIITLETNWNTNITVRYSNSEASSSVRIPNSEPNHFIIPFLSKRKVDAYNENVRESETNLINNNLSTLAAKLTRINDSSFPFHLQYKKSCEEILWFTVTAIQSTNGRLPWIYLPDGSTQKITQMGEGVANIVWLLTELAIARWKLFLIEEPENDLHPLALKSLLDYIIASSEYNQFIISTHSNIVVQHLASVDNSRLFRVDSRKGVLPTEAIVTCIQATEDRISCLRELGYSFSDFWLWDWWLILEEASAERIIRDYIIPWFIPTLSRVRTISAWGTWNIEATFQDFHRLMLFSHLEPIYKGYSWVRVDWDDSWKEVINKLKNTFNDCNENTFWFFSENYFENYYPKVFKEDIERVLSIEDKQKRREEKISLLKEVIKWLDIDIERGKQALQESASEIIQNLQEVEKVILEK